MPKTIILPPNEEINELCEQRGVRNVADLDFEDLITLSENSLKTLCAQNPYGDWWAAYRNAYKAGFKIFNHESWDITLSFMGGGRRLCGMEKDAGKCPMPFERNLDFWQQYRTFTFKNS